MKVPGMSLIGLSGMTRLSRNQPQWPGGWNTSIGQAHPWRPGAHLEPCGDYWGRECFPKGKSRCCFLIQRKLMSPRQDKRSPLQKASWRKCTLRWKLKDQLDCASWPGEKVPKGCFWQRETAWTQAWKALLVPENASDLLIYSGWWVLKGRRGSDEVREKGNCAFIQPHP